jgi:hypothetical protein
MRNVLLAGATLLSFCGTARASDELLHVICTAGTTSLDMRFGDQVVASVSTTDDKLLPDAIKGPVIASNVQGKYTFDDKTHELHAVFKGIKMELYIVLNPPAGAPNKDHYDLIDNQSETTPLLCRKA